VLGWYNLSADAKAIARTPSQRALAAVGASLRGEMSTDDKIPIPLQAISGILIPGVTAALYVLVWETAKSFGPGLQAEAEQSRSAAWLLIPALFLIVGCGLQYRYVRRQMQTGMMDSLASPLVITALTAIGAVVGVVMLPYLPLSTPSVSPPSNGSRISFGGFVSLFIIWLCTIAGLMIGRRSTPAE
jgi:hypothetical protein